MGYGCKYWNFNFDSMQEECKLTGENLETCYLCSFEYESCANYQEAQKAEEFEKMTPLEKLAVSK